jgi:hypothetical protein
MSRRRRRNRLAPSQPETNRPRAPIGRLRALKIARHEAADLRTPRRGKIKPGAIRHGRARRGAARREIGRQRLIKAPSLRALSLPPSKRSRLRKKRRLNPRRPNQRATAKKSDIGNTSPGIALFRVVPLGDLVKAPILRIDIDATDWEPLFFEGVAAPRNANKSGIKLHYVCYDASVVHRELCLARSNSNGHNCAWDSPS